MLSEAQSMLSRESTKYVPNFIAFLKLLNGFCFLKGTGLIALNFRPYSIITQMPKYIGAATAWTFYIMSQHIIELLKLYNTSKIFIAAILKRPVFPLHYPPLVC